MQIRRDRSLREPPNPRLASSVLVGLARPQEAFEALALQGVQPILSLAPAPPRDHHAKPSGPSLAKRMDLHGMSSPACLRRERSSVRALGENTNLYVEPRTLRRSSRLRPATPSPGTARLAPRRADDRQAYPRGACRYQANVRSGGPGKIDDPPADERSAVIDPHLRGASVRQVLHVQPCIERQPLVRGCHLVHVVSLAVAGLSTVVRVTVPAGDANLIPADTWVSDRWGELDLCRALAPAARPE